MLHRNGAETMNLPTYDELVSLGEKCRQTAAFVTEAYARRDEAETNLNIALEIRKNALQAFYAATAKFRGEKEPTI